MLKNTSHGYLNNASIGYLLASEHKCQVTPAQQNQCNVPITIQVSGPPPKKKKPKKNEQTNKQTTNKYHARAHTHTNTHTHTHTHTQTHTHTLKHKCQVPPAQQRKCQVPLPINTSLRYPNNTSRRCSYVKSVKYPFLLTQVLES